MREWLRAVYPFQAKSSLASIGRIQKTCRVLNRCIFGPVRSKTGAKSEGFEVEPVRFRCGSVPEADIPGEVVRIRTGSEHNRCKTGGV
jgi:hypothetical protein